MSSPTMGTRRIILATAWNRYFLASENPARDRTAQQLVRLRSLTRMAMEQICQVRRMRLRRQRAICGHGSHRKVFRLQKMGVNYCDAVANSSTLPFCRLYVVGVPLLRVLDTNLTSLLPTICFGPLKRQGTEKTPLFHKLPRIIDVCHEAGLASALAA